MAAQKMKTSDFDYSLPRELVAQTPIEPRDDSRLMVLHREDGSIAHCRFFQIVDYLKAGDVLVFNDSRVIPARLLGRRRAGGGKAEILLLHRVEPGIWEALVKPGKHLRTGASVEIAGSTAGGEVSVVGEIVAHHQNGSRLIRFSDESLMEALGKIPLPPYIHAPLSDPERYQTIYARVKGSVAAPTAGLHFTPGLLERLQGKGVEFVFVTLHVSWDSFRPVRTEDPSEHQLHQEYGELSAEAAKSLNRARAEGRRIVGVGTTATRLLEAAADEQGRPAPFRGWVGLYILPGYRFRVVDSLVTNFHLPRSTLLMLVSAFAGRELILRAYQEAISQGYRFYSFGDGMIVL